MDSNFGSFWSLNLGTQNFGDKADVLGFISLASSLCAQMCQKNLDSIIEGASPLKLPHRRAKARPARFARARFR